MPHREAAFARGVLRPRLLRFVDPVGPRRHGGARLDRARADSIPAPRRRIGPRSGCGRHDPLGWRSLRARALGRRCISGGAWLAIAVAIPALLFLLSTAIVSVAYGETVDWWSVGRSTELPELARPLYWLANVLFYGFDEEVGWRGFALPRLQARSSALRASLLLALGWAGWHLPLFVFADGLSSLGAVGAVGWLVSLALGSILLTWLFNSSDGSIGAVALFHAALAIFFTSPVAPGNALPNVMGALLTMGTLLLIPVFGRTNLSRRSRVVDEHQEARELGELHR